MSWISKDFLLSCFSEDFDKMGLLDSFKPRKLVIGSPYISVTSNGVSINKSAIDKLEYAEYIKFLVDEQGRRLAVQVCGEDDPDKVQFVNPKRKNVLYVRWNNREFTKQLLNWAPREELKQSGFKVPGEFFPDEKVFIFAFDEAVSL